MANMPDTSLSYEMKHQKLVRVDNNAMTNLAYSAQNDTHQSFMLAGFSAHNKQNSPETPDRLTANQASHKRPLVDYLLYRFKVKDVNELTTLRTLLQNFYQENEQPDMLFYCGTDGLWYLTIQINQLLDAEYLKVVSAAFENFGINKFKPLKSTKITTPLAPFDKKASGNYRLVSIKQRGLIITDDWLKDLNLPKSSLNLDDSNITTFTKEQILDGIERFGKDDYDYTQFANETYRQAFWLSILNALKEYDWKDDAIDIAINTMAKNDNDIENQYHDELKQVIAKMDMNPRLGDTAKPIGDYLPLYEDSKTNPVKVTNLAAQLRNTLNTLYAKKDEEYAPDPRYNIADTGDVIAKYYTPYLLNQAGDNKDNVVIFNPLTGVWVHDEDLFMAMANQIKPYTTQNQLQTMLSHFGADAYYNNRYIEPYHQSQYLLFHNGCLNVSNLKFYDLDSQLVRNLHFTARSQLSIDYKPHPQLPKFPHGKAIGDGDWDPESFITAYANNDKETLQFLLFGLSLGLFGGHNFGIHFDIQGSSRWGKTTLSEIYLALYNERVATITYSSLNERFPFNNYSLETSVIWISEANVGSTPLNNDHGTVIYDGLADNHVNFEVKGQQDINLVNPPQVYIDGTQLIQAEELDTGPAGRTLAYELPDLTQDLQKQAYGNDINRFLSDESVLQWLVWQMIDAYRKTIPTELQGSLKMNLNVKTYLDLLPQKAREWRTDLVNDNSDLTDWFENYIEPYLTETTDENDKHVTYLHDQLLYNVIYDQYYMAYHPHDRNRNGKKEFHSFVREFKHLCDRHGWKIITNIGTVNGRDKNPRKRFSSINGINFDWKSYYDNNGIPDQMADQANPPAPFRRKVAGWFKMVKAPTTN